VIRVRPALMVTAASLLVGQASPCWAQDDDPSTEPPDGETATRAVIVAVDFDSIPIGALPPAPTADDAPEAAAAEEQAPGISVQKMKIPPPRKKSKVAAHKSKMPSGLVAKTSPTELVELGLDHAESGTLYVPAPDDTDFAGESVGRLRCHREGAPSPLRWETATASGDDHAEIAFKDLWFYSETCTVRAGSAARAAFKAVAWDGARPWLYAIRDARSVTFLMPRSSDVSAEASVGAPVTVRGGFTRVSLPLGRWGSSSFVAHLSSMTLDAPAAPSPPSPPSKGPPNKGNGVRMRERPLTRAEPSVEVAVELVQTMSEKSPTLLVRRIADDEPIASQPDRK
jgi:hypothetical protein